MTVQGLRLGFPFEVYRVLFGGSLGFRGLGAPF